MAFTLSGTTITQSGTDTSLAGLSGISGVTTTLRIGGFNTYDLGILRLNIAGNLKIGVTATNEMLVIGQDANTTPADIEVVNGGHLEIGRTFLSGTVPDNDQNKRLIYEPGLNKGLNESSGVVGSNNAFIRVRAGGSFTWRGGTIDCWGGIGFDVGSIVTIGVDGYKQKPVLDVTRMRRVDLPTAGTGLVYCYTNVYMYGLIIIGGKEDGVTPGSGGWGQLAVPSVFKGYEPRFVNIAIAGSSSMPAGTYTVENYLGAYNSTNDIEKRAGGTVIFNLLNGEKGTKIVVSNNPAAGSVTVNILENISVTGESNAVVSLKGSDSIFYSTLLNGSGSGSINNVLIGQSPNGTANINKFFGLSDIALIHQWSFAKQYTSNNVTLRGINGVNSNILSLTDTNVTLSETNAVAKLASSFTVNTTTNTITVIANSTLDDLYDVMKAWKTRNVQAQLEYPAIATQPVVASGTNLVTSMNIVGIEFLTTGTKFKTLQANATANGTISNLSIVGNVNHATPTNLSNVTISGTLTYNTNTATSIAISNNTSIGTVANSGTGIVTISRDNTSSITTYTDAEINFLDSNISAVGITNFIIFQNEYDRGIGAFPWVAATSSLNFKYGSVVDGVTMRDTVFLRVLIGGVTIFSQITLTIGTNTIDLGIQGQLSSINAKLDLTAKETTLLQTETDIISEINANEDKIDTLLTNGTQNTNNNKFNFK